MSMPIGNDELDQEINEYIGGYGSEPEDVFKGGDSCNKPGMYHVACEDFQVETDSGMCMLFVFDILAGVCKDGSEMDQAGKKIYHRIYLKKKDGSVVESENVKKFAKRLAYALGLIGDEEMRDASATVPYSRAPGFQCVCEVALEQGNEYTDKDGNKKMGKDKYRVPFGNFWPVGHADVAGVPKDQASLAILGESGGDVAGNAQPADDLAGLASGL